MSEISAKEKKWEARFGVSISILATILAINELGASKFAEDELAAGNERTQAFMWYQSKGVKETVVRGQADLIDSLLGSGGVNDKQADELRALSLKLRAGAERYKQEKQEILLGSAVVGEEN